MLLYVPISLLGVASERLDLLTLHDSAAAERGFCWELPWLANATFRCSMRCRAFEAIQRIEHVTPVPSEDVGAEKPL